MNHVEVDVRILSLIFVDHEPSNRDLNHLKLTILMSKYF